MDSPKTDSYADIVLVRVIVGAILGIIGTFSASIVCLFLYELFLGEGINICHPFALLFVIMGGTIGIIPWTPLGAFIGASTSVYMLQKSEQVPRTFVYSAYSVLFVVLISWGGRQLSLKYNPDRVAIGARYNTFCKNYNPVEYGTAYMIMSPQYHKEYTPEEFLQGFGLPDFGECKLHPNYSVKFANSKACLYPGNKQPWSTFDWLGWHGAEFELEQIKGEWYFTGRYDWHMGEEGTVGDVCPFR
jgi:hypothetical protein